MSKPPKEIFEEAKLLDISDLLEGMKATKRIELTSVEGQFVVIRKLSHLDMTKIWAAHESSSELSATGIIVRALVEPKLSMKQINALPASVTSEIAAAISDFSGLTGEAQERTRDFLEETKE